MERQRDRARAHVRQEAQRESEAAMRRLQGELAEQDRKEKLERCGHVLRVICEALFAACDWQL